MRKLEGLVKEIQDENDYLKKREMRFQSTNGGSSSPFPCGPSPLCWRGLYDGYDLADTDLFTTPMRRIDQRPRAKLRAVHVCDTGMSWDVADFPP